MAPPKGNQYWRLAKDLGRDAEYSPLELWNIAIEYFEWVENNPLQEEKVFGTGKRMKVKKLRAMTIRGLCVYAKISSRTFEKYNTKDDYIRITARIKDIIYTQKFEGAAAGLFESNIIARELGLADKQNVNVTGNDIISTSPLNEMSVEQLEAIERIRRDGV